MEPFAGFPNVLINCNLWVLHILRPGIHGPGANRGEQIGFCEFLRIIFRGEINFHMGGSRKRISYDFSELEENQGHLFESLCRHPLELCTFQNFRKIILQVISNLSVSFHKRSHGAPRLKASIRKAVPANRSRIQASSTCCPREENNRSRFASVAGRSLGAFVARRGIPLALPPLILIIQLMILFLMICLDWFKRDGLPRRDH